ncbi:MAG: hypothetical protein ACLP0J_08215 [Solirubrobacteraceae bacterium]
MTITLVEVAELVKLSLSRVEQFSERDEVGDVSPWAVVALMI